MYRLLVIHSAGIDVVRWSIALALLMLCGGVYATSPQFGALPGDKSEFLSVDKAFRLTAVLRRNQLSLHWEIASGYYLYQHKIVVTLITDSPEQQLHSPVFVQSPVNVNDPNYGEVAIYRRHLDVLVPIENLAANAQQAMDFLVVYQGCVDAGVYYPVQRYRIHIDGKGLTISRDPYRVTAFDNFYIDELFGAAAQRLIVEGFI